MTESANIRLERNEAHWRDRFRSYKVLVDEIEVREISDGETLEIPVSPGSHTLRLKIDWTGSRKVEFSIGEGETKTFSSCPFRGPAIIAGLRSFFQRDRWILLKDEDDEAS
jgi:hypothetical protein